MIIGVTGSIASGKSILTSFLKERGFIYLTLSKFLKDIAAQRNIPIERKNLQDLGNKLREEEGNEVLAKYVVEEIKNNNYVNVVIESIRNPFEIRYLKNNLSGFYLISFEALKEIRFNRVLERKNPIDPKTWEDFVKIDDRDQGIGESESGQGVKQCIDLSDYHIINDDSLENTIDKINKIYNELLHIS